METIDIQHQQLSRSRRNSIQPIDRHINEIHFDGTIYINAGIDSTCGIKRNSKSDISTDANIHSLNASQSTSMQSK